MDPQGKSGGMFLGWGKDVKVYKIVSNEFCMEVELETKDSAGRVWAIFIYASNKERIRYEQWQYLITKK